MKKIRCPNCDTNIKFDGTTAICKICGCEVLGFLNKKGEIVDLSIDGLKSE
jgi:hypothetical protein